MKGWNDLDRFDIEDVTFFLGERAAWPLLTKEEEAALAAAAQRGDIAACERLVGSNARFTVSIAIPYYRKHQGTAQLLELLVAGEEGARHAVTKFDGSRGVPFIAYAVAWIRQRITRYILAQRTISVPADVASLRNKVGRATRQLEQLLHRQPRLGEIAEHLGMSERALWEEMLCLLEPVSLDAHYGDNGDEGDPLLGSIEDVDAASPRMEGAVRRASVALQSALEVLEPRERKMVELRFGLSGHPPMTLQEVGNLFGVTRERVRQIEAKALRMLRHPNQSQVLRPHFNRLVRGEEGI